MRAANTPSRQVRELLLAVARSDSDLRDIAALSSEVDPLGLVEASVHHHVVSLVHERLRGIDTAPQTAIDELGRRRVRAQIHRLHLEQVQSTMTDALRGIPWLLLKGNALAQWYSDPSTREFNDIDILVTPDDFERALDALGHHGIVPIGGNWRGFHHYEVAEIPLCIASSSIDLHWDLVAMGEDRRRIVMPVEMLYERSVSIRSSGIDVRTLDPVDTLLHLCVNQGLDGGRRLRGLIDIDTVVRSERVGRAELVRRADRVGAGPIAAAVLQRAHHLLGTPVPTDILHDLCGGRAWLAANAIVDRAGVRGWRPSGGIASGLLLGSGRDSAGATVAAFGRSLVRAVSARAGRPGLTERGGALDWQRLPSDGDIDLHRREYLDWVAATATRHNPLANSAPGAAG